MLTERDLRTNTAGRFAFAAARDANRYSDECRMLYTPRQRAQAETLRDVVVMAYSAAKLYVTYRKKFVAIKLTDATVRDRRVVRELELLCEERGYEKTRSAQGIIYRIPRVA
jgi:hypothetical protein